VCTKLKTINGLIIVCLFLAACNPLNDTHLDDKSHQAPRALEGVLDLRNWDFEKDGSINLAGEWTFYWEELLTPDQIVVPNQAPYVEVPAVWTNHDVEGLTITPEGHATYHLTVYPPDTHLTYGLYVEGQGSAYKLWIDGRLLAHNGQVGIDSQTTIPEKIPSTVFFQPDGNKIEIVLQISNFHHRKGGFRNSLLLGMAETVHQYQMQNWFKDAFPVGILLFMGLYHLFIYAVRTRDRAPIYFALLCLASAARIGVTNQSTALLHWPMINWFFAIQVEYLIFFLAPPLLSLFMQSLYPRDIHRWFIRTSFGLGICFTLFMLVTDTMTLSYSPPYYQGIIFLQIIYYVYFLERIIARRREGAIPIALASAVLFAAITVETLSLLHVLPYGQIASYGFLAYIIVQAISLSSIFSKSFHRVETLTVELGQMNIDLLKSERKYRNIFEDSQDIIFIAGLDGQIDDVSPACEQVLGYTKEEFQQGIILDQIIDLSVLLEFRDMITEQESTRNFEVELKRKDGQKIDALITATLHMCEDGEVSGVQGIVRDITSRKQAEAERLRALKLEQLAITDPLTKIYNRRFFFEGADKEITRAKRTRLPLSLVIFDIDQFKEVNDTFGHIAGDQVLVNLVNLCQQNIRSMDLLARFGGEEFVILMPHTDSKSARESAERFRLKVAEKPMTTSGETDVSITISMGIASWNYGNPLDVESMLDHADQALYLAKEAGRNQTIVWGEADD